MQKTTVPSLKREIGAVGIALNAINLTIGAGIFVLPAIVSKNLGPAGFIAYFLCGSLVVLIMLCFAESGSKITTTGGAYAYVERAFGPLAGFIVNTLFWFGFCCLADAAVINALTDMLAIWFPVFSIRFVRIPFFIIVYALFTWVNVRGVKQGSRLAITATVLKLAPLVLLVLIGLFSISPANLVVKTLPGIKSIGDTALVLFFAFMGIETALTMGGEIKDPQRNIPKGVFMGVAGVVFIYLLLQLVAQGVMGSQLSDYKDAPLAALASRLVGPVGGTILLITSVVSMFGLLCGDILASPRIIFAASRDNLLPGFLSRIHPKFATPYWSIIVYSLAGLMFASTGGFQQLAVLASSSVLLIYLAVVLATVKLRYMKDVDNKGSFRIPGGLTVPLLAIVTIGWFLSHITREEIIGFSSFFVLLSIFYFIRKYFSKGQSRLQNSGDNFKPGTDYNEG